MHQLVGSLPHHILRNLANIYGPLMHLQLGEVSTVVDSTPEAAKEIMRAHDNFYSLILATPACSRYHLLWRCRHCLWLFAPYGEYWR
ncbi:putative premnaspirodiene oxygenase [Rosa chinensis]|uniref:Putative premnaspirodiene oxygenase n=1 Tax=Rosa chinensis TaxID=74649 RepID=A0A2P6QG57_ROSCH|nr:putative premnaspirodiene oxygenase [Rosa chinensis]